ncbi:hypothetical protein [Deinococcus hohokamensis]|uniref:Uncharacterized protein n=1 Tax=Deinococcus hohokamensis TaxID=309883 RepID=A0ABV9IDB2_9DEIO
MSSDFLDELNARWQQWSRSTWGTPLGRLWGRMKSYGVRGEWSDPLHVRADFDVLEQTLRRDLCEFRISLGQEVLALGVLGSRDPLEVIEVCLLEAGRKMNAMAGRINVQELGLTRR